MIENDAGDVSAEHGAKFNPFGASLKTEFKSSVMRATNLTEGGSTICEVPMSLSRRMRVPNETDYQMLKIFGR